MNDFVRVPPDSSGKKIDALSLDVGVDTVYRQRVQIAGTGTADVAIVSAGAQEVIVKNQVSIAAISATVNVAGTFVISTIDKISATVTVVGTVSLAAGSILDSISATVGVKGQVSLGPGTSNIGSINNISATVAVTGTVSLAAGSILDSISATVGVKGQVSLGPGTSNIGFINGISATVTVTGTVALGAGAANIGIINNISATVGITGTVALIAGTANIGAVSLAAGTANIGFINGISATVTVTGTVVLGAGAANIGTVNNISAAVVLAAGANNIGTINNISAAVVIAAGANNIGTIDGISATVTAVINGQVAHSLSVTAGVLPVLTGMRAHNSASAAVSNQDATYAWGDRFGRQVVVNNHPSLLPTASHGPKCVTASTSAGVALIAAPGAGLSVYITMIACTNGSATLTKGDVFQTSATASCIASMYMAANGGGFVMKYDPPVQLLSNSGATCRVDPSVSQCIFNVHFYVGPK